MKKRKGVKNKMTEEEKKLQEEDKKAMETIVEALTPKAVDAVIEKMKAEQPLRKNIFGDGSPSEKAELEERKKDAAEYLKRLVTNNNSKALSAGTSTSGSELVPTYVSDQIVMQALNYGLIRKYAYKWPMQGINENIPTMTTLTAYRLAGDTAAITSSQPTTGTVNLRAKTVGVIVPVSKVLLQNSTANLVDAITYLAGKAIAKLEDTWGFLGLNTGEGIFQNASVPVFTLGSGNTTYSSVSAENLLDVENLLDENFVSSDSNTLRWIMSRSVLNVLRRQRSIINGTPNQPQGFLLPGYGVDTPPSLWDHPYDTSAVMPKVSDGSQNGKKFLSLVDYENIIHGDAMEYTMEISDQATITDTDGSTLINLFQQNMVALKIWGLVDIQLSNPSKAFANLATSAS